METFLLVGGVEIIEEDSADTSGHVTMLDPEVIVTPGLELGVILSVVIVTHILQSSVKMDGVLFVQIVGGEVTASAKPPSLLPFRLLDLEVPVAVLSRIIQTILTLFE